MTQYRFVGSTWNRNGTLVTRGDVIEPTESELQAFGDLLRPLDTGDDVSPPDEPEAPEDDAGEVQVDTETDSLEPAPEPFDGYDDYNVSDLGEVAGNLSTEHLQAALAYEKENEDRKTAKELLETELADRDDE